MSKGFKFIELAKQTLQMMKKNGEENSSVYKVYAAWASGYCLCGRKIVIIDFCKTGSGVGWRLQCGHGPTVISLQDEVPRLPHGSSYSRVGVGSMGGLSVHVEKVGKGPDKEGEEISVAKLFCHHFYPLFDKFKNDKQDSPYDVIAESKEGKWEYFQVTKLENQNFWKELNTNKKIDTILLHIEDLVSEAIERKSKYDSTEKQKIILLIDVNPGILKSVGAEIKTKLADMLLESGFKEIWLTGATPELTYRFI